MRALRLHIQIQSGGLESYYKTPLSDYSKLGSVAYPGTLSYYYRKCFADEASNVLETGLTYVVT
jgi:hypothetical protein